ncbi:hypothetical protein GOBAR_AA02215 [Gossypium barbadense]|uniref:ATP-dependent helicase BRM n=1 Tax=Gossypium barbadense TaxID=3634 RepID=A0A2P5YRY8_GOSBA|nr:hypothetical protein GOBAR_AA02215 [Gossypium barbadense]
MQSGGGGGAGPCRNLGVGPSQQLLRKPEVNEAILAYQASGLQGMLGGSNFPSSPGSMQPPQQSRKFFDLAQQHASAQDSQNRSQGVERQTLTPFQQAYYQYAYQTAQQQKTLLAQQQAKMATLGSASVKDQDMQIGNFKMLELTSMQAANQAQASSSKNLSEQLGRVEKQIEHGPQSATDQRNEPKPPTQGTVTGQLMHGNVLRAMQAQQAQQTVQNTGHDQLAMAAQLQSWALERNIDLSQPANANLMAQLIPLMQSRMAAHQKTNESNMGSQSSPVLVSKRQATSPSVPSDSSPRGRSSSDISSQSGSTKTKPTALPSTTSSTGVVNNADNIAMQQLAIDGQDKQVPPREPLVLGNEMPSVHPSQSSPNISLSGNPSLLTKNSLGGTETAEMQYRKQLNENFPQSSAPNNDGGSVKNLPAQGKAAMQMPQKRFGFTKQQLHVLKAQILAFRRLKKGEGTLPHELLRAIVPPPVELQQPQLPPLGGNNQDRNGGKIVEDPQKYSDSKEKVSQAGPSTNGQNIVKEEAYRGDDKATSSTAHMQGVSSLAKEFSSTLPAGKEEQQGSVISAMSDQEVEHSLQKTPARSDFSVDRRKAVAPQLAASDGGQVKKPVQANSAPQPKDPGSARKYHGPLFDFPFFTRKHDSYGSVMPNSNNNLTLAYDVKELLFQEGVEVFSKKRSENLRKIGGLLAVNLERKRIRPDLVLRLQIEEKKLRLIDVQARLRDEVDQQQQEITAMPDRPYRKFVRLCERQRMELARQIQATQKALREKQLKSIFQWRKKLLEAHWAIRDARTAHNRGVAKYHERMLREFSKRKDDDRNKRMEALKNNDVERYREMLIEQQTNIPGDAAERYEVLSSFLTQTEEYLHKLGGLSEEEVRIAAACAGEEVMIRNHFMEMNAPRDGSSVSKYYNLAHAINERVIRQPSMLRAGTLRDYQLVGLQWMLSLYNNKLNGILADEMGLGKTVQVMALIAYLMEFKGNYGPHLIIVPNAVLVNWKEVLAMKFNVLVTTYEFIMYDRSKLSKIDWKYIIIDEAQRMKDRESVLARDLDRFRCQRRLLLTGTPLQAFHDWFSQPFQKEGPIHNAEDDWLETEKKVIIIHRLHQILEPFMLRRRIEDVEGSLPPKVSIVLRCRMSAIQSAIYDWIKSTGTLRVDPEDEKRRVQKNPIYQAKVYKTLNNRCMELRKTCNHPLLNYPYFNDLSKDFLVRSCGKLWILDRILIKLQRTGHRVLLFSTMTKLLDILEEYLQWRRLVYRRIDGTTSLEDRESAIVDFNSPDSECFIFLLSIRAAGRGLNLQTADTVVIYDPDPNPKNEEQAVARAHRIGQTREVKVIYMEAVVDKISSQQKEDEIRSGGTVDFEVDFAGKDRYMGSIESLIRNNIQQYKIDMADEVINAGRFDQRTTHEERRMTLETLLHDEERYQETVHDVPSLHQVNRMIARSEEEVELFDQMDEELDWTEEMTCHEQVPKWLRASTSEVNATVATLSKKPSKNILFSASVGAESHEMETERKRGRPKGKKHPNYKEIDNENGEYSEASSDERNGYSGNEEEREIGEVEDDEFSGAVGDPPITKYQSEDGPLGDDGYEYAQTSEHIRNDQMLDEAGSSGSSLDSRKPRQIGSPISPQKFGSLSALDARPGCVVRRLPDELEEGEIAASGDSHVDHQQSESWIHDRDEGEFEQVVQPKIKRKRSIRVRPRHTVERAEEKSVTEVPHLECGGSFLLPFQLDQKYQSQLRIDTETKATCKRNAIKHDPNDSSSKCRRNLPSRKIANTSKLHASLKSGKMHSESAPVDAGKSSRESWDNKLVNTSVSSNSGAKMSDLIQRKCKNVISKLQRRIDKEGEQIVPLLTDLWKRIEKSGYMGGSGSNNLDLQKIDQRVDRLEYSAVMELVADVQLVLKSAMQFYGFSLEVRSEARKVHDLFFDLLKIAFPDTDFREARNALSFSSLVTTSTMGSSARQAAVGKRQKLINEVESDSGLSQKSLQRRSSHAGEDTRVRVHMPQKESRVGCVSGITKELYQQDDSILTHPGELVICKKKRKDREKSMVKPRTGLAGPVSPPSIARSIKSPTTGSFSKDAARLTQQTAHQQSWHQPAHLPNGASVSWANPVKKLRTDAGKRRPSHL